ncbi:hypothetical protein VQ056_03700 [Paenibacillus sp. JTLBN-2024]|uniref:Uncharacterized protein n=1 Tax=Paenibacillus cookii TaxID=157839 RepID=A0ABQ4LZV0_9BACL|nr:hypothetical protein J21TS3_36260 [Paenibacillus cookii]
MDKYIKQQHYDKEQRGFQAEILFRLRIHKSFLPFDISKPPVSGFVGIARRRYSRDHRI